MSHLNLVTRILLVALPILYIAALTFLTVLGVTLAGLLLLSVPLGGIALIIVTMRLVYGPQKALIV